MTLTAALTAVKAARRPFGHRERMLPTEAEAPSDRIAVSDPDPLEWPPRRIQADMIMQCLASRLFR